MKLVNRVVVITGAGAGIGRACAGELAKEGARLVVADINRAAAGETVARLKWRGGNAIAVEADVSQADSVQNLVKRTLESFSEVHVLLNNAAIHVNKTVEDTTVDQWTERLRWWRLSLFEVFPCPTCVKQKGASSVCCR